MSQTCINPTRRAGSAAVNGMPVQTILRRRAGVAEITRADKEEPAAQWTRARTVGRALIGLMHVAT